MYVRRVLVFFMQFWFSRCSKMTHCRKGLAEAMKSVGITRTGKKNHSGYLVPSRRKVSFFRMLLASSIKSTDNFLLYFILVLYSLRCDFPGPDHVYSSTYYLMAELAINGGDEQACNIIKPAQLVSPNESKPFRTRKFLDSCLGMFQIVGDSHCR